MDPNSVVGCSGAGNPLQTLSKLAIEDKSTQHDARLQMAPGIGESMRSRPRASSTEDCKILDEFLRPKPPQLDLPEHATTEERDDGPRFTQTLPSTGSRAYAGNWQKEAETFRQGIGRQDNNNMLRRQLGFEVAGLQEMVFQQPPDKPALNWHETMIECLKQRGEAVRMREHASGVQDALTRNRAEFVMASMLKMLKDGQDVPIFDFARGVPPILSPDIGSLTTSDVTWAPETQEVAANATAGSQIVSSGLPYDEVMQHPNGHEILSYFLRGEVVRGLHADYRSSKRSDWSGNVDFTSDPYCGLVAITDNSKNGEWNQRQAVLNVSNLPIDYAAKEGKKSDIVVMADRSVYNPLKDSRLAGPFAPRQYKCTKESLARHSKALRDLFEMQPNLNTLVIEDTPEWVVNVMIAWMYYKHAWVKSGLDVWYVSGQDASTKTAQTLRMPCWSFYLSVLEAATRYKMDELQTICDKALLEIDIFGSPPAISIHYPTGRTHICIMLYQLYMWTARCTEQGSMWFDEGPLTDILRIQVPKMVDLLKSTDDGASQLRKDILYLYEKTDALADKMGGSFWRFREDHQYALEDTKKLDYEEVVQDQDGIWTLQIKADALKVASKL